MKNSRISGRTPTPLIWPVTLLGAVGLWLWLGHSDGVAGLLGVAALVLTVIIGIVLLSRARAARRFNAAVDTYAQREIDRERRWKEPQRVPGGSAWRGAVVGGSMHRQQLVGTKGGQR
jgi:hypothetical protein